MSNLDQGSLLLTGCYIDDLLASAVYQQPRPMAVHVFPPVYYTTPLLPLKNGIYPSSLILECTPYMDISITHTLDRTQRHHQWTKNMLYLTSNLRGWDVPSSTSEDGCPEISQVTRICMSTDIYDHNHADSKRCCTDTHMHDQTRLLHTQAHTMCSTPA